MTVPSFTNLGASANPDINSSSDATSYANSSWTPPTDGIIVVWVWSRLSGTPNVPTISGNSLTWVEIDTVVISNHRLTLFAAVASGATAGVTTIDFAGQTQIGCQASFHQETDIDLSGGVAGVFVQTPDGTGSDTSGSITLASAGHADNRVISCFTHAANEGTTERGSWTELDDMSGAGPTRGMNTQYRSDAFETTASASWTTSATWLGMAAEIKGASGGGGGGSSVPAIMNHRRNQGMS